MRSMARCARTLTVGTQRSAKAFAFGARGGILTTSIPEAANTASKAAVNLEPAEEQGAASRAGAR